jgi:transcriptional regulator with XRE-family HTH domain
MIVFFVNKPACLNIHNLTCNLTLMRYGERLRAARLHAGLTQAELAVGIGGVCTQANISGLEKSLSANGSEFTVQFANACQVNALWLATGEGVMFDNHVSEPVKQVTRRMQTLSEREQYRVAKMIEFYLEPAENDLDATPEGLRGSQ